MTLCTAANLAAPWSDWKCGAKTHPEVHFRRRNLHAPHGGETVDAESVEEDLFLPLNDGRIDDA